MSVADSSSLSAQLPSYGKHSALHGNWSQALQQNSKLLFARTNHKFMHFKEQMLDCSVQGLECL